MAYGSSTVDKKPGCSLYITNGAIELGMPEGEYISIMNTRFEGQSSSEVSLFDWTLGWSKMLPNTDFGISISLDAYDVLRTIIEDNDDDEESARSPHHYKSFEADTAASVQAIFAWNLAGTWLENAPAAGDTLGDKYVMDVSVATDSNYVEFGNKVVSYRWTYDIRSTGVNDVHGAAVNWYVASDSMAGYVNYTLVDLVAQ